MYLQKSSYIAFVVNCWDQSSNLLHAKGSTQNISWLGEPNVDWFLWICNWTSHLSDVKQYLPLSDITMQLILCHFHQCFFYQIHCTQTVIKVLAFNVTCLFSWSHFTVDCTDIYGAALDTVCTLALFATMNMRHCWDLHLENFDTKINIHKYVRSSFVCIILDCFMKIAPQSS